MPSTPEIPFTNQEIPAQPEDLPTFDLATKALPAFIEESQTTAIVPDSTRRSQEITAYHQAHSKPLAHLWEAQKRARPSLARKIMSHLGL